MLRAAVLAPTVLLLFLSVMHMQATAALLHPVMAVGTWGFSAMAVEKAMEVLKEGGSALDAVEKGINVVEQDNQEQYYVGRGGYPNADGVMELDAAVMDGGTRRYGAVAALKGATRAVSVARAVLEHSPHNIIVGEGARKFAETHGLGGEDPLTEDIKQEWREWKANKEGEGKGEGQHDTIGLICTDCHGNIAAGTSTSGWRFKHPGRVGDSPVVGSGLYADKDAGAAVATGDGEEIMRVCLSFLVVEKLREGKSPTEACRLGIQRLKQVVRATGGSGEQGRWHEQLTVAVVCVDKHAQVGAASTLGTHNPHRHRPAFPFVVWREGDSASHIEEAADVEDET